MAMRSYRDATTQEVSMRGKHRHSRYVAGCATCELDLLYARICLLHGRTDQVDALWRAGDAATLRTIAAQL